LGGEGKATLRKEKKKPKIIVKGRSQWVLLAASMGEGQTLKKGEKDQRGKMQTLAKS